jgi:hypothetical protein
MPSEPITYDVDDAPKLDIDEMTIAITSFYFLKGYPDQDSPPEPDEYEIIEAWIIDKTLQIRMNEQFIRDLNHKYYDQVFNALEAHRKQEEDI